MVTNILNDGVKSMVYLNSKGRLLDTGWHTRQLLNKNLFCFCCKILDDQALLRHNKICWVCSSIG